MFHVEPLVTGFMGFVEFCWVPKGSEGLQGSQGKRLEKFGDRGVRRC